MSHDQENVLVYTSYNARGTLTGMLKKKLG
jgi:hypothetical protein